MALFDDAPNLFGRSGTVALPGFQETMTAFLDLNVAQVATLFGVLLWAFLLCLPLTGIDRRDRIAAVTYAGFLLAAGVTLLIAVPHWRSGTSYSGALATPGSQVAVALGILALAARRWRGRIQDDFVIVSTEGDSAPTRRAKLPPRGERYE